MPMAQQEQVQMVEETRVMEEIQVIQEALTTTGAKPQVEEQAKTEVQVTVGEGTIVNTEMITTIQPIKHTTQVSQTAPNNIKERGAPFAQDLNLKLIQHSSAQCTKHQQTNAGDYGIWDSAATVHVLVTKVSATPTSMNADSTQVKGTTTGCVRNLRHHNH
ncbi:MAG: hypothetical protein AAGM46_26040 [Cyanobacteria bacterium J06582_2]